MPKFNTILPRHSQTILPLFVIVFFIAFNLLCFRPSIHGNDGVQNVAYLISFLKSQHFDFTETYSHYFALHPEWFNFAFPPLDPITHLPINLYGIANSILWAPLSLIAFLIWGSEHLYDLLDFTVCFHSLLYVSIGSFLLYEFIVKYTDSASAIFSLVIILFATPLLFYSYAHGSMSHANSFFMVCCIIYLDDKANKTVHYALLGLCCGLLVLTRFQDLVLLIYPLMSAFSRYINHKTAEPISLFIKKYLLCVVVMVSVILLQTVVWHKIQGSYFSGPRAYVSQGSFTLIPYHLIQTLFSPFHGLFYWHPILLLGLFGLVITVHKKLSFISLCAFLLSLYIISSWSCWWAGASFGQRMFISSFPFLAIGIAQLVIFCNKYCRYTTFVMVIITFLACIWNLELLHQYGTVLPHDKPVSYQSIFSNVMHYFK